MTGLNIYSQNLRGNFKRFVHEFESLLNQSDLAIILIQDMGNIGPDGPHELRQALAPHKVITNATNTNKSKNTGIILHKNWELVNTRKHESGGLTGAEIRNANTTLFVMSAYLPTSLDGFGMPESFDSTKESEATLKQEEAHAIYSVATDWTRSYKNWILGGDLNETIEKWDRKKLSEQTYSYHGTGAKFIQNFLNETRSIDLWRILHPYDEKNPEAGHTCFHNKGRSSARLDYFIISKDLLQSSTKTTMLLGEWYKNASDHVRITCKLRLKEILSPLTTPKRVVAIHTPNVSALAPGEKTLLATTINHQLLELTKEMKESRSLSFKEADELSNKTAKLIVNTALQARCRRTGEKTERSQYERRISERLQTIKDTCDLIRQLKSTHTPQEADLMELDILMDRLCMCDIPNLPVSLNRSTIQTWVEHKAEEQIEHLENCLKVITKHNDHKEQMRKRDLFLNPQTKGRWLEIHFKTSPPTMPNFAIDDTGRIFREPNEVKNTYLTEGTLFLRKKLAAPGPEEEKKRTYDEPPDLKKRVTEEGTASPSRSGRPKWWNGMYNRSAKNLPSHIWSDLMTDPSAAEILTTINKIPNDKAAGYDGTNINLIKLLAEKEDSPLTKMLTCLFKVAFREGATLPSWRKAVITMIPKRKEDGSWTEKVRDMRPISVLQEFGKIAAKILAERWGKILLEHPQILNNAQRAFIKDGCVQQCISTALNIFEDFQERKDNKELYVVSYDQEKAYDQTYTIRVSLERFNMPEKLITYVLSGLQNATSCFKTYFGLTEVQNGNIG